MDDSEITANFARQSMMQTFGATLDRITPGVVTISAPILPTSLQQQGAAHAALPFAIGDSAMGYAALTKLAPGTDVVTAEIKINLLSLGVGDRLRATGKVIKPGRRLVVTTAEVHALTGDQEKLVAILQATMVPLPAA